MKKPGNEALKDQWVNMRNRMTGPMANAPSMVKLLQQKGYATPCRPASGGKAIRWITVLRMR